MRVSTTEPTVERYSSVWTLSMDPPVSVVPVGVVFSVVASVVALAPGRRSPFGRSGTPAVAREPRREGCAGPSEQASSGRSRLRYTAGLVRSKGLFADRAPAARPKSAADDGRGRAPTSGVRIGAGPVGVVVALVVDVGDASRRP